MFTRYIISLSPHLYPPPTPHAFSPSLISLMDSVDVKHHVYLLTKPVDLRGKAVGSGEVPAADCRLRHFVIQNCVVVSIFSNTKLWFDCFGCLWYLNIVLWRGSCPVNIGTTFLFFFNIVKTLRLLALVSYFGDSIIHQTLA